jgi:hypothetical protein
MNKIRTLAVSLALSVPMILPAIADATYGKGIPPR